MHLGKNEFEFNVMYVKTPCMEVKKDILVYE